MYIDEGIYDLFGNMVEVRDGVAFDVDANEDVSLELVLFQGEYIKGFDD